MNLRNSKISFTKYQSQVAKGSTTHSDSTSSASTQVRFVIATAILNRYSQ